MRIAFISNIELQEATSQATALYDLMAAFQGLATCDWIGNQISSAIRNTQEEYSSKHLEEDCFRLKYNEICRHLLGQYPYKLIFTDYLQTTLHSETNIPIYFVTKDARSIMLQSLSNHNVYTIPNKQLAHFFMERMENMIKEDSTVASYSPLYVYAVNLRSRLDRRRHIISQYKGRDEFNFTLLDAIENKSARLGLWKSLCMTVKQAKAKGLDYFIFCEDDHIFTKHYNPAYLRNNIEGALKQKADILCGGIGGTDIAIPVSKNRFCIGEFYCTQFVVVFSKIYDTIINYSFQEGDTADGVLSVIAKSKMTIYPFVSTQRSFGYSDVTPQNNHYDIENYFRSANEYLSKLHKISLHYPLAELI